uniref:DUF4209 domain-containing protein n=1 Tax=Pseudoclavibacter sp. RFBI5 TaxID=2080578 RepID=UPI0015E2F7EA|nr:DUF4209 domain-containing protein [Pseudoclavibacter sp. RFBI5]
MRTAKPDQTPPQDWETAFHEVESGGVFREETSGDEDRLPSLWSRLNSLANSAASPDVVELAKLLGQVASFMPRPDDWARPYEPMWMMHEGRSALPSDLTQEQVDVLIAVVPLIPDAVFKARVSDVLALRSTGKERIRWFTGTLEALREASLGRGSWPRDDDTWDRALLIARRLGSALDVHLEDLTRSMTRHVLLSDDSQRPGMVADLLLKHHLAQSEAEQIATRMREFADEHVAGEFDATRGYLRRAVDWFHFAGNTDEANSARLALVKDFIAEADALDVSDGSDSRARSGHLYEQALKALRTIPRRHRTKMGVGDLTTELATRIRAAGAAMMGQMGVFESEAVDLSELRKESMAKMRGKAPLEAVLSFLGLSSFARYESAQRDAEAILEEFPLQGLFSNTHFSHDGRIIYRSSGKDGELIYGEDPAVWRQMIQAYEFRLALTVQGALAPAWVALSNEHHFALADFLQITRGSSIVPADRERLIAQAFCYGYGGDFLTAAQLLAPQIEHIVRLHVRNAGFPTTTMGKDGIENEIGLSSLMSRDAVVEIFGPDITFEIRALFCGPIGPNLRNEFAHGLTGDASVGSANALYCWWFMLRLVFVPFYNRLHDARAADNQEPAERPARNTQGEADEDDM